MTNSLSHSDSGKPGGAVTVAVTITPEGVLAEVADDGGHGEPGLREPAGDDAERGRGLLLVDELADAWGHYRGQDRLVTWFSLKAPPRPAPATAGPALAGTGGPAASQDKASHAITRA